MRKRPRIGPETVQLTEPASATSSVPAPQLRPSPYLETTQHTQWRFSPAEIAEMRARANADAAARYEAKMQELMRSMHKSNSGDESNDQANNNNNNNEGEEKVEKKEIEETAAAAAELLPPFPEPLTAEQELLLCRRYIELSAAICKKFSIPEAARFTAILLMKRFYLLRSMLEYNPKIVMLATLALASKVEDCPVKIETLVSNIKVELDIERLREIEFIVAETVKFDFRVAKPATSSYGVLLDIQQQYIHQHNHPHNQQHYGNWRRVFENTIELLAVSVCTDLALVYTPAQIAFAAWLVAAQKCNLESEFNSFLSKKLSVVESVMMENATAASCSAHDLRHTIDECAKILIQDTANVDAAEASRVMRQLEQVQKLTSKDTRLPAIANNDEDSDDDNE